MELAKFITVHGDKLSELISFLIAVWAYPYLRRSYLKWFMPFLGFIFLSETASNLAPVGFYSTYLNPVFEVCIYGYVFFELATGRRSRICIIILMACVLIAYVFSYFFLDTDHLFMFYYMKVSMVFSFIVTAIALNYLYRQGSNDFSIRLLQQPGVWIAFGVSIFFSGFSLAGALYSYMIHMNLNVFGIRMYNLIPRILSVVLYSCLSVAIVLFRRRSYMERNRSRLQTDKVANINHLQTLI
jgi:hypothetical protein